VRVGVRLFARYREAIGHERLEVDVPEGGTVEAAWAAVIDRHPALSPYRSFTLFAIGNEYVPPDHSLCPGDELCLFPPVSGGSDAGGANGLESGTAADERRSGVRCGRRGRRSPMVRWGASTGGERRD
jgi:molybdopterin converting factor small subunit